MMATRRPIDQPRANQPGMFAYGRRDVPGLITTVV
jgi:hypothetical protein